MSEQSHKIKVGVEVLGQVREAVIEVGMSAEEWHALTEGERNAIVEEWAYQEIQMGTWYEDAA